MKKPTSRPTPSRPASNPSGRPVDRMTDVGLNAVLEYLSDEVEAAETKEELMFVLALVRELFNPNSLQNAVVGLNNIRAEIDCQAIANAGAKRGKTNQSGAKRSETVQANSIPTGPTLAGETRECTVQLDVPQILSSTFQQLSERMRTLQSDDPDTFANATSALTWLASGTIRTN